MRADGPGPESGGFYSNAAAVPTPQSSFRRAILKKDGGDIVGGRSSPERLIFAPKLRAVSL
jgi:hypothetical protein